MSEVPDDMGAVGVTLHMPPYHRHKHNDLYIFGVWAYQDVLWKVPRPTYPCAARRDGKVVHLL